MPSQNLLDVSYMNNTAVVSLDILVTVTALLALYPDSVWNHFIPLLLICLLLLHFVSTRVGEDVIFAVVHQVI